MDPFTVMQQRGQLLTPEGDFTDFRRRMYDDEGVSPSGPTPTPRAGGRKMSPRDMRSPQDLVRSRRVGLSQIACAVCGSVKDEGYCAHAPHCEAPGAWYRRTTGPMAADQTSKDVGWESVGDLETQR